MTEPILHSERLHLIRRIGQISRLLAQLKQDIMKDPQHSSTKDKADVGIVRKTTPNVGREQLKSEYEALIVKYMNQGPSVVNEFTSNHTSRYLEEFIKANSLPISTRTNKKAIYSDLLNQLARSVVIRGTQSSL